MEEKNNSLSVGGLVQVLRQRYFVNHNPDAKTQLIEEYTIIGNKEKGAENVILQSQDFLPNLTVYDSDGEELPVMPNNYTKILLKSWIKLAETDEKGELKEILLKMKSRKLNLIWIKLSENKKIEKNESRVINLEYNAVKSKNKIIG